MTQSPISTSSPRVIIRDEKKLIKEEVKSTIIRSITINIQEVAEIYRNHSFKANDIHVDVDFDPSHPIPLCPPNPTGYVKCYFHATSSLFRTLDRSQYL